MTVLSGKKLAFAQQAVSTATESSLLIRTLSNGTNRPAFFGAKKRNAVPTKLVNEFRLIVFRNNYFAAS